MASVNVTSNLYDLTNATAGESILDFIQFTNDITGQVFMMGVLLVGAVITFNSMKSPTVDNRDALIGGGFIISILSVFFTVLNFIPLWVAILIVLAYAAVFSFVLLRPG